MARIHLETPVAAPVERVFDLARDIDFHQRSLSHTGERAVAGRTSGLIGLDETVTWRARHLGRYWSLTSRVTEFEPPIRFVDEQVSGPFTSFRHEHRFRPTPTGTLMIDDWEHQAPFGWHGTIVDALVLGPWMSRVLSARGQAMAREAEARSAPDTRPRDHAKVLKGNGQVPRGSPRWPPEARQ